MPKFSYFLTPVKAPVHLKSQAEVCERFKLREEKLAKPDIKREIGITAIMSGFSASLDSDVKSLEDMDKRIEAARNKGEDLTAFSSAREVIFKSIQSKHTETAQKVLELLKESAAVVHDKSAAANPTLVYEYGKSPIYLKGSTDAAPVKFEYPDTVDPDPLQAQRPSIDDILSNGYLIPQEPEEDLLIYAMETILAATKKEPNIKAAMEAIQKGLKDLSPEEQRKYFEDKERECKEIQEKIDLARKQKLSEGDRKKLEAESNANAHNTDKNESGRQPIVRKSGSSGGGSNSVLDKLKIMNTHSMEAVAIEGMMNSAIMLLTVLFSAGVYLYDKHWNNARKEDRFPIDPKAGVNDKEAIAYDLIKETLSNSTLQKFANDQLLIEVGADGNPTGLNIDGINAYNKSLNESEKALIIPDTVKTVKDLLNHLKAHPNKTLKNEFTKNLTFLPKIYDLLEGTSKVRANRHSKEASKEIKARFPGVFDNLAKFRNDYAHVKKEAVSKRYPHGYHPPIYRWEGGKNLGTVVPYKELMSKIHTKHMRDIILQNGYEPPPSMFATATNAILEHNTKNLGVTYPNYARDEVPVKRASSSKSSDQALDPANPLTQPVPATPKPVPKAP